MPEPITIRHRVEKASEGLYYTIDFPVPAEMARVTVRYRYKRLSGSAGKRGACPVNIVDLGLAGPDGTVLGWSGSDKKSVFVGEYESTRGYLCVPVAPGNWKILVGAYKVERAGVEVTYEIDFTPKAPALLFGELHCHSDASDGQYDIPTLCGMASKRGLDFLAVTNHNNYAENLRLPSAAGLTLIPGVEWTHYKGHINFLGAKQPFGTTFVANSEREMLRIVADAKARGALISVNHPKDGNCPYLWQSDDAFDMLEIWNGLMRPANSRAIAWWTALLCRGRRVPAVGGSDFHRSHDVFRLGRPVNAVYAASRSACDILAAVAAGKSYVTSSMRGPRLSVRCEGETFGGTVRGGGAHSLSYRVEQAGRFARLRIVTDAGTLVFPCKGGRAEGEAPLPACRFAYLAVIGPGRNGRFRAVSNPIYFES